MSPLKIVEYDYGDFLLRLCLCLREHDVAVVSGGGILEIKFKKFSKSLEIRYGGDTLGTFDLNIHGWVPFLNQSEQEAGINFSCQIFANSLDYEKIQFLKGWSKIMNQSVMDYILEALSKKNSLT